jgi:hypothetical protein
MFDFDFESGHDRQDFTHSLEYLNLYNYQSKGGIIFVVAEYLTNNGRKFVVTESDRLLRYFCLGKL